jgi:hypothetical protein
MAKGEVERQIRYNIHTFTGEQEFERHRWIFFIINEPKELKGIREKIFKQLEPISFKNLGREIIPSSGGLYYDCFAFTTQMGKIEKPNKIYASKKFKLDRDLFERSDVGLDAYLTSIIRGRK